MSDIAVVESDEYRQEIEELKKNPVIQNMAEQVVADGLSAQDFKNLPDIQIRSLEYARKMEVPHRTIGGPYRAILSLVEAAG